MSKNIPSTLPAICGTCKWHHTMQSQTTCLTWCDLARRLVQLDNACPAWRSAVDMPTHTHVSMPRIEATAKMVYTDVLKESSDCGANTCEEGDE